MANRTSSPGPLSLHDITANDDPLVGATPSFRIALLQLQPHCLLRRRHNDKDGTLQLKHRIRIWQDVPVMICVDGHTSELLSHSNRFFDWLMLVTASNTRWVHRSQVSSRSFKRLSRMIFLARSA